MSANIAAYAKLFGNIGKEMNAMARCACVSCNSCTCACSCKAVPDAEEIVW